MNFKQLSSMNKLEGEYWLEEASRLMDIVNYNAVTVEDMEILAKFTAYFNIHGEKLEEYLNDERRKYRFKSREIAEQIAKEEVK